MFPAVLSFLFACISMPTAVFSTLSSCKSHRVTSLKDSMMSSWLISQSTGVNKSLNCALLCLREQRCVSFLYNDVIHDCRLFAVVKTLSDVTSSVAGYRYYDTCRAAGYYGSGCDADGDCRLSNTHCFQSRCRCQAGYSFNASAAACVAKCNSYGPEFEYIPGWFVDGHSQEFILDIDTADCLDACREATAYICRTAEMRLNVQLACSISDITKLDVSANYWKTSSSWEMVYYQRHCRL